MSTDASNLLASIMQLSTSERGEIASRLLESLDPDAEADVDAVWAEQIRQ